MKRYLYLALFALLVSAPANASLIQDIYLQSGGGEEGEEGGGGAPTLAQIGTFVFTTDSSTDGGAALVQADILLGGVQFTLTELQSATWEINAIWELFDFEFVLGSPNFGPLSGGYEITLQDDEFNPSGLTAILSSNSNGCDLNEACLNETIAVSSDLSTLVRQGTPAFVPRHEEVPEPTTLLLLGLGLAGLGLARRRLH